MLSLGFDASGPVTAAVAPHPLYRDRGLGLILWGRFWLSDRAVCTISLFLVRPDVHLGEPFRPGGSQPLLIKARLGTDSASLNPQP